MSNRVIVPVRSAVPAASVAAAWPVGFDFALDTRWNAWIAAGKAHDIAARRRIVMTLPLFAATAIAVTYLFAR